MMCKLLSQQAASEVDIDMFDGDSMEFHYFMAVFHEAVEKKIDDARGRLTRLIKFTKGEAKDIVKNCIQLPPDVGFKTAKQLLYKRFGNPHRMIAVCQNQIKKWSQIKAGDADGYRRFQNFLIKCDNINQLQAWNILDSPHIICMLVSRLPGSARDRWSRKVLGIRRDKGREPDMKDFIYFANDETVIMSDPRV